MAPPQLPLELQDLILSHVQGGKVDLCNCSLVNREWLELSRRYLFRTLVVTAPSRGTFYNFIHLLRGAAHIGDSIETLTMQGVISYKSTHISDRTTWLSVNPFPILHSEDVRDVVERTPRLKTLVISFVKFAPNRAMPPLDLESETDLPDESGREYSPPGPARERRKLDRLHLLNLRRVPSSDVSFVYDVISMFAEIGELMLCYDNPLSMSRYGGRRTRMMPTVPVMPHVEDPGTAIGALEVRAGYSKAKHSVYALVERLRWGAATQPVTTLVWESKPVILEELGRFLPAHATHLRTLDLTVSLSIGHIGCVECPPDYYQWNGIIELSALPALQSLTLTHDVYYKEPLYPAVAAHTDLLRRPPPALRHIALRLPLTEGSQWRLMGEDSLEQYVAGMKCMAAAWDSFDKTLARVASLEELQVVFMREELRVEDKERLSGVVTECLPRVQSKGMLEVVWEDSTWVREDRWPRF